MRPWPCDVCGEVETPANRSSRTQQSHRSVRCRGRGARDRGAARTRRSRTASVDKDGSGKRGALRAREQRRTPDPPWIGGKAPHRR